MNEFKDYKWVDIDDMLSALQPVIEDIEEFQESVIIEMCEQIDKKCYACPNKNCKYYDICVNDSFDNVHYNDLKELLSDLINKEFSCPHADGDYYCCDCEEFFYAPDTETDGPSEKCPLCGGDDIEEC